MGEIAGRIKKALGDSSKASHDEYRGKTGDVRRGMNAHSGQQADSAKKLDEHSPRESADPPVRDPEFGIERYRSSPPFVTTPMRVKYEGENKLGNKIWNGEAVKYYDERARQKFLLTVREGKIYDVTGRPFHTTGLGRGSDGHIIFVMDRNGRIFASKYDNPGEFHHSSLVAGEPVAAAGTIHVENGVLQGMRDASGHYKPRRSFTLQAIHHLRSSGVDITPEQVYFIAER